MQLRCFYAEAPYSRVGSNNRDTRDTEQQGSLGHVEAPFSLNGDTKNTNIKYRPMTPGEEEIMRIYEDGIYLLEKPGGLQIYGSGIREGRSYLMKTALRYLVVEAAEPDDSENGITAHCGTALHRPVVEPLAEPEDSENGDATHCGTALHRSIVETVEEKEIFIFPLQPL